MKQVLVANLNPKGKCTFLDLKTLIDAQIENSLNFGWNKNDIIILSNFAYQRNDISTVIMEMNDFCFSGSKVFALKWLLKEKPELINDEPIWSHDLDAWQNSEFETPDFLEVGICEYSQPKFNGGSIFWRSSALDLIEKITCKLQKEKAAREEPTLDLVLKDQENSHRVTILNSTFNVGCSGFYERWNRAEKPVKVLHFHPTNSWAIRTHLLDVNGIGEKATSQKLEKTLRKYWPGMMKELDKIGLKKRLEKIEKREKNGK